MSLRSGVSKREARQQATEYRRRQAKQRFEKMQTQIWHDLPFEVPAKPRIYLAKSPSGPKHVPRLPVAARQVVQDRPLLTIAHNGTITHAGIPNPNYVADSDQVKELKDVRSTAGFFLPTC
jgi:hypothetical protein